MGNFKVFKKGVKDHSQGHMFNIYGTIGKVLSPGTHMANLKALFPTIRMLWAMFKFLKSRSKRSR